MGPQVFDLGVRFYHTDDFYKVGKPLIEDVFENFNLNAELALYNENSIVVIYRR